jgi:hypothetical protein
MSNPTPIQSFDPGLVRNQLTPTTDAQVVTDFADFAGLNSAGVANPGANVTSIYTGGSGAFLGILRIFQGAKMSNKDKAMKGVVIFTGAAQTASGLLKVAANAVSLVGAKAVSTAVKANAAAASSGILGVRSGVSSLFTALLLIPVCKAIDFRRKILDTLKNDAIPKKVDMEDLKSVAPEAYKKLRLEGKDYSEVSRVGKIDLIKEIEKSQAENALALTTLLVLLVGAVLGAVFTAGAGALAAAIVGLIGSLGSAASDTLSMVGALKKAKSMSNTELVIKSIMVVLAVVSLVLSVVFAPTLALAIAAGVVGVILVAIPLISIIVVKANEAKAKEEAKAEKEAKEREEALELAMEIFDKLNAE